MCHSLEKLIRIKNHTHTHTSLFVSNTDVIYFRFNSYSYLEHVLNSSRGVALLCKMSNVNTQSNKYDSYLFLQQGKAKVLALGSNRYSKNTSPWTAIKCKV